MYTYTYLAFFVVFIQKICFYHFHLVFDEVSKFRKRILNNQKPELGIRNCQGNSRLHMNIELYKHVEHKQNIRLWQRFSKDIFIFEKNKFISSWEFQESFKKYIFAGLVMSCLFYINSHFSINTLTSRHSTHYFFNLLLQPCFFIQKTSKVKYFVYKFCKCA